MISVIIITIVNFVILYLIFHYFKWKFTSHNFLDKYEKQKEEICRNIESIIGDINRATERNLQILEAKIEQLKSVSTQAEKLFTAIIKEQQFTKNEDIIYKKLERGSINYQLAKVEEADKKNITKEKSQEPEKIETIKEKVIAMYKNGIGVELISQNLGIASSEVELIISISKIG